jgi:Flp pilus assembly protein protease CpaA
MAYALVGAVLGAVLTRIFVLLKRRATRVADANQMDERLSQLAL